MRINNEERAIISDAVHHHIAEAEVFLFGSRVDDAKKGGDIDILAIGPTEIPRRTIGKILDELEERLGEQKIDLVYRQKGKMDSFGELIMLDAVPL